MPDEGGPQTKFMRAEHRAGRVPLWTKFAQGFSALPGQHKEWDELVLKLKAALMGGRG